MNYPSSFIENLTLPELTAQDVQADVLRLDRLHPVVSGNKWFKLKGHLQKALQSPGSPVLTFGGAWSNHIIATAYATKQTGLSSIGFIRGEKPTLLSATLQAATAYGMQLEFIDRATYRTKEDPAFLRQLADRYPGVYIIPEGGGGPEGIRGSGDILQGVPLSGYTHILCAIGTGTTFLGLLTTSLAGQTLIGVPVLKGMKDLSALRHEELPTPGRQQRARLLPDYHFGGYGRHPPELLNFMNHFYEETGIPTDIVYTGKLFYAVRDSIRQHLFPAHSRLLIIHSGGLQGNQSLPPGTLKF